MVGHLAGSRFTGGFLWQTTRFGLEAVTVFFVLSGYVIAYVTTTRETSPAAYAAARATRMYSVVVPALLVTFLLDGAGHAIHPDLYSQSWGYPANGKLAQFVTGLLFLNEIWFTSSPVGSSFQFWSLGFEVWYYVLFGIAVFARGRERMIGILIVALLIGPKILLAFPLWLLGAATWWLTTRFKACPRIGWLMAIGGVLAWISYDVLAMRTGAPTTGQVPRWGYLRPIHDTLIGLFFAVHLFGVAAIGPAISPLLERCAPLIRWASGATFSIYLLHLTIAQFITTLLPWPPQTWASRLIMYSGTIGAILVFAELTERRKAPWQRIFNPICQRLFRRQT